MAKVTAASFSTGSEPGRPRHTGQMLRFGSSPKPLRQPQNSLVAVAELTMDLTADHELPPLGQDRLGHDVAGHAIVRSSADATWNITASPLVGASTWTPIGSP